MTAVSRPRRLALAALLAATVVADCARRPPTLPPPIPLPDEEAEALGRRLERQAEGVQRYQGLVRVRGKGPEGGFDARLVVIFERPGRLRVELLGAFGGTRWSAVVDAPVITAYFPGDRHYVREEDVPDVVGRLLGLALDASDVMALLTGVGRPVAVGAIESAAERGRFTEIRFANGDRLLLDEAGRVTRAETSRYVASYPTEWKRSGRQFPREIRVENETVQVTIYAEEVDANVPLDPEAFMLSIPPDAERLRPAEVEGEAVFVRTGERPEPD